MKLGIIGVGMVGGAIKKAAEETKLFDVKAYDKYKGLGKFEDVLDTEALFVCVPTPTIDGMQAINDLRSVLLDLGSSLYKGLVVIKCTVIPKTMDFLQSKHPELRLAHNPEFLTERNAFEDFVNQKAVLTSSKREELILLSDIYSKLTPKADFHHYDDFKITETAKYLHNCFLATKVAFMNEFYEYCSDYQIPFSSVVTAAVSQGGVGAGHTKVPGPDGKMGFGGACFPKDTDALTNHNLGYFSILRAATFSNRRVRKD